MRQPNKKEKELLILAETKGNDADLMLLDKLQITDDRIDAVEIRVDDLENKFERNPTGIPLTDEARIENIATRLATKIAIMEQGIKGDDGYTPTRKELIDLITPLIPQIQDGHTPTDDELLKLIIPLIPQIKDGKDGSPDTPLQIRDKLEELKDEERLDKSAVKGWEEELKKVREEISRIPRGGFRGGTPHNLLQTIDVSSQINGTTREFTGLPTARFYPFVFSSQSPFILLPTTHYTIGRNAITLGNNVEPPQSGAGAYLFVTYIK